MSTTQDSHTLVIIFNEFFPDEELKYREIIADENGDLIEEIDLDEEPTKARFDAVFENGSGDHNHWNAHRAKRIYGHSLQKQ